MDIAVLDYRQRSVVIIKDIDEGYIKTKYKSDVSKWLVKERGFNRCDISWMSAEKLKVDM